MAKTTFPRIWVGNSSWQIAYFDGSTWTQLPVCSQAVSRSETPYSIWASSPSDVWVLGSRPGYNHLYVYRYNGTSWSEVDGGSSTGNARGGIHGYDTYIWAGTDNRTTGYYAYGVRWNRTPSYWVPFGGWYGGLLPWAVSNAVVYWTGNNTGWGLPSGVNLWKLNGAALTRQGTGQGLPTDTYFWGVCQLGSELFVYAHNGNVYRGTFGGSWVVDNSSDGPFTAPTYYYLRRAITSDGDRVAVCDGNGVVWVRNGPDDWESLGNCGASGAGEIAMWGDFVVVSGTVSRIWDGDSWGTVPNGNDQGVWMADSGLPLSTAPILQNQDPAPDESGVEVTTSPYLELYDANDDLDVSSVEITVSWVTPCGIAYSEVVYASGSFVNGWSGTVGAITKGSSWLLNPPSNLPYAATVRFDVYAEDDDANVLDTYYVFQTRTEYVSPTIEFDPPDGSVDVPKFGPLVVKLRDTGSGINLKDTLIKVDKETVFNRRAGGFPLGWGESTIEETEGGYDIVLIADRARTWRDTDQILLEVSTADCVGNEASASALLTSEAKRVGFKLSRFMEGHWEVDGIETEEPRRYEATEEEEEEEEYEEMQSPTVTYVDADTIAIDLPPLALGNAQRFRLQDGEYYSFSGGDTVDLDVSGIGGVDTGVRTTNTWYHIYLVPYNGVLRAIASANAPSAGPSGFSNYLPIMTIRNRSGDTIRPFNPVIDSWCRFIAEIHAAGSELGIGGSDNVVIDAWHNMTLLGGVVPVDVADQVEVFEWHDSDPGDVHLCYLAEDASPSWTPSANNRCWDAEQDSGQGAVRAPFAIPNGELAYYVRRTVGSGTFQVWFSGTGFRHKYRV